MQFNFKGAIWDGETQKVMARADANGVFETEDTAVIKKLTALGYKPVNAEPDLAPQIEVPKPKFKKRKGGETKDE